MSKYISPGFIDKLLNAVFMIGAVPAVLALLFVLIHLLNSASQNNPAAVGLFPFTAVLYWIPLGIIAGIILAIRKSKVKPGKGKPYAIISLFMLIETILFILI